MPVKVTAKRDGVYHVYRKFSTKEMKADLRLIQKAQVVLDRFDQTFNNKFHRRVIRNR